MQQSWVALLVLSTAVCSVVAEGEWGYEEDNGPRTWPEHYEQCGGKLQSPIRLSYIEVLFGSFFFARSSTCTFTFKDYSIPANVKIENNGHTVNLSPQYSNSSASPRAIVEGCDREGTYVISGIHFHWQSEHVIDGRRGDLEMHVVHKNDKGQFLVLGFLFEECWESETRWGKLTSVMDQLRNPGDSVQVQNFRPDSLLVSGGNMYVYKGSLTTPPCTESVLWVVHSRLICVSQDTLKKFYGGIRNNENEPMTGNYRPLQDKNGRQVFYVSQSY